MSTVVYEMMVKVKYKGCRVRVWVDLATPELCTKEKRLAVKGAIRGAMDEHMLELNPCILANMICFEMQTNHKINAIEVTNKKGNGGLYYPDWP